MPSYDPKQDHPNPYPTEIPTLPLTIDGPREEIAEEVAELSPEGRPADSRVGPGLLAAEVVISILVIGLAALGMGIWLGWPIGAALFVIGMLAIMFNPAITAALLRMRERNIVAHRHGGHVRPRVIRKADIESRHY